MKAYVGIADNDGLRSFVPEGDVPDELMVLDALTAQGRGWACFWATIDDEIAVQVREELASGWRRDALSLLLGLAKEVVDYPGGPVSEVANPGPERSGNRASR